MRRRWIAGLLIFLAAATSGGIAFANADADDATKCEEATVPIEVGGQEGVIAGTLCTPPDATTLQVLVHGWTYQRDYFDSPYKSDKYSYRQVANKAGYATFAIDRLGAGSSLHPLGLFDTLDNQAHALHKVIESARAGDLKQKFDKVMTVSHSIGSVVATAEAGKYDDVDAVVTLSYSHVINPVYGLPTVIGRDYLAAGDKQFADQNLDPLYITSMPGTRYAFYNKSNTDPAMIEADEKYMRNTTTLTFAASAAKAMAVNPNAETNVPVLAINGEKEPFFCGAGTATCDTAEELRKFEADWYGPQATVEAHIVKNGGHDVNLEKTAGEVNERMVEFADKHVGAGEGKTGTAPGQRVTPQPHEQSQPPLVARTVNKAFTNVVLPVIDKYADTVEPLPGAGDGHNPVPLVPELLEQVANLNADLLGDVPLGLRGP